MRDSAGIHIPSAMPQHQQRQLTVLRILGRLEFATSAQLSQLIYPMTRKQVVHTHLMRLLKEELIWRVQVPFVVMPASNKPGQRGHPMKLPYVYGLTAAGKQTIDILEIEADQRALAALKARDPGIRPPSKLTLTHDLQASWWCSSLLQALRINGHVRSLFMQVEFVVHERQRMDALAIIRLTRTPQPIEPMRWPFFDGTPRRTDEVDVRLALEIDRGTEPLPVLLAKGAAYRDLHAQGTYNQAFGGPVLPVFLVPTPRRAAQIAREWRDIWPDGWGVVATPRGATSNDGVLWGDYRSLMDAQPFPLLSVAEQHPIKNTVQWSPLTSREVWVQHNLTH